MSWGRLDDKLPQHRKSLALAALPWQRWAYARALWTDALAYCHDNKTRGRVPAVLLPRLTPMPAKVAALAAEDLVAVGFWDRADDGYAFHNWDRYSNPKLAEQRSEAGRKGAAARWGPPPEPDGKSHGSANGNGMAPAMASAMAKDGSRAGARARPDPDPDPDTDLSGGGVSDQVVQAPASAGPPPPQGRGLAALSDPPLPRPLQRRAFLAYEAALSRAGGIIANEGNFSPDFAKVGELAEKVAGARARQTDDVLREWAVGYVTERHQRRPDWWLQWCVRKAGSAAATTTTAPAMVPSPDDRATLQRKLDEAIQTGKLERADAIRKQLDDLAAARRRAKGQG